MNTLGQLVLWLRGHSSAILATVVTLQNSHLIGGSAGKVLAVFQGLLSVLGGT
jgi:hypothetical protein